jgi:rfaE bifunctional protein nucleotidyltransferase chain/domain
MHYIKVTLNSQTMSYSIIAANYKYEEDCSVHMNRKLMSRDEITKLAQRLRAQGKTVVTINGSFDILHAGHAMLLREAKAQGDVLIVGLNSDESVRKWKRKMGYRDWDKRPFNPEQARADLLSALQDVDYVTIFDEETPIPLLEAVKPDVHVNGSDYGKDCIEAPTVKRNGGRLHVVKLREGYSTSGLLKRMKSTGRPYDT